MSITLYDRQAANQPRHSYLFVRALGKLELESRLKNRFPTWSFLDIPNPSLNMNNSAFEIVYARTAPPQSAEGVRVVAETHGAPIL